MTDDVESNHRLILMVDACGSCHRDEASVGYLTLRSMVRSIMVRYGGMYNGHPANFWKDMSGEHAVEILNRIVFGLVNSSMEVITYIEEEYNGRNIFENILRDILEFKDLCNKYPNATIRVETVLA